MKPLDLITWAIAIGFAWAAFVYFIPIDRWVGNFLARRQARLKELEERVAALERKFANGGGSSAEV